MDDQKLPNDDDANKKKESPQRNFLKTTNIENGKVRYDYLHASAFDDNICNKEICKGSIMRPYTRCGTEPRSKDELIRQAKHFFNEYYTSIKSEMASSEETYNNWKKLGQKVKARTTGGVHSLNEMYNLEPHQERWAQVVKEIEESGTYNLKETELTYGAKLAWRNAPRCIGRMQWSKLQVFDARYVTLAGQMFDALCKHIQYATNKGNIRSAITIFPPRTDGHHDFRIWNGQLIMYAGYKQDDGTVIGDPANVEFTELCLKLGWKGKYQPWEILPLVLSADGQDPEVFEVPENLVMRVKIEHPHYPSFKDLNLEWYCVPAVSDMLFDIGGLEFTAAPFNGWYMGTEIGVRDFCDENRFNILPIAAQTIGLDTSSPLTLWKDKALVEVNIAVLYSFQKSNVTIVDHHTTTEVFMRHYETEHNIRKGCPADWVWLVPPMSGSITPVFHQEMMHYHLKPAYEYQEKAWKTHAWQNKSHDQKRRRKKLTFRELVRAVNFAAFLYRRAVAQRIKATILYATETGRSEKFAYMLKTVFNHAFNTQVMCMADYDIVNLEHEACILFVASTFGNGDPPENGEDFVKHLVDMKVSGDATPHENGNGTTENSRYKLKRALSTSTPTNSSVDMDKAPLGPLANVRYSVFALGSRAYPSFAAFGNYLNNLMSELGAECFKPLATGDELSNQEGSFSTWAREAFSSACETFCISDHMNFDDATKTLSAEDGSSDNLRLRNEDNPVPLLLGLKHLSKKSVFEAKLISNEILCQDASVGRETMMVKLDVKNNCTYEPGDHLAVYACNEPRHVKEIMDRFKGMHDVDRPVVLQEQQKARYITGIKKVWVDLERISASSLKVLFTHYLDINVTPSVPLLTLLQETATTQEDKDGLNELVTDADKYNSWKHEKVPRLVDVLRQFPSLQPEPALLVHHLPLLLPRYYSISSSPKVHDGQIHLTIAVVKYCTQEGAQRKGLCSNYLRKLHANDIVHCFHRKASRFHLPFDDTVPLIMVGPGTGIAPFRGFWHHRKQSFTGRAKKGEMVLFFGCRTYSTYLYQEEIKQMVSDGVINEVYLALSREANVPKKYVQDIIMEKCKEVFDIIVTKKGHFYVCGDVAMAEAVSKCLKCVVIKASGWADEKADRFMQTFYEERYHEDIFGVTLQTAEVHNRGRLVAANSSSIEST